MRWVGHSIAGMALFGFVYYIAQIYNLIKFSYVQLSMTFIIIIVYSLLPDIDQQGSKINNYINVLLVISTFLFMYLKKYYFAVLCVGIIGILQMAHHRRCIHSILVGGILSIPLYFINPFFSIVAFTSYLAHLVIDGEVSFFMEKDWW